MQTLAALGPLQCLPGVLKANLLGIQTRQQFSGLVPQGISLALNTSPSFLTKYIISVDGPHPIIR